MATYGLNKASPLALASINETRTQQRRKKMNQAWYLYHVTDRPRVIGLFSTKSLAEKFARRHARARLGSSVVKFIVV